MGKKQIVFIHGGTAFSEYEDFLYYLKTREIDDPLDEKAVKKWKSTIRETFGDTHEVYYPSMPNSSNAKYEEWKIWFERYQSFLRDNVVLVGHSLGGYFLARYLSETTFPVRVAALYLLAAPFENDDFGGEDGGDFAFDPAKLPRLAEQVGAVHVFHSTDDPIVPFEHARKNAELLKEAELVTFTDKNHFILEEFPEFIAHFRERYT